ncbi:MAG: diaminopimelate epimerase [Phycisphaerales bacterium]|nr:diaminopimelate epimerase [Phycisphaerales bacterium]
MQIPFVKMHGCENDYLFIDLCALDASVARAVVDGASALSRAMSNRHTGVGADGIILISAPSPDVDAEARMRIFNADGSEAEMCGNGIRCACAFVHGGRAGVAQPLRFETGAGVLDLKWFVNEAGAVDRVAVDMGVPRFEPACLPVRATAPVVDLPLDRLLTDAERRALEGAAGDALGWRVTAVSMGNPHITAFVDDVDAVALEVIGPVLECASAFPSRINVHVVTVHSPDSATMRTWERGSGLTRACGTGAAAALAAGVKVDRLARSVRMAVPGGMLHLSWPDAKSSIIKTGPATTVCAGVWSTERPWEVLSTGRVSSKPAAPAWVTQCKVAQGGAP